MKLNMKVFFENKRMFYKVFLIALICISFCTVFSVASAENALDEIQNYVIKVEMRSDGTMDIYYHLEWKVLDDTSEGPLSWVKVGIPNSYVDEITAKSTNINNISYYSDNGSYVRIDLDRKYYAGEIISFDFSIHQSRMYIIENDQHICRYSFTPGWFDNIEVKNIVIMWNSQNVLESNAMGVDGNYLTWQTSLGFGGRLNASVKYNLDVFTTNEDEQYVEGDKTSGDSVGVIIIVILLVILFGGLLIMLFCDDYGSHGGFGGGYRSTYIHHSSCARSSCACVSSCACACACAGGGRAGCSKKDFYGTKLNSNKMKKAILNKNEVEN